MEEPYSKREIDEKWVDIANSLSRIEVQTTLHNGRMKKSEIWQAYMTGGMSVLTFIVVPILGWALFTLIQLPQTIDASVDKALSAYEITPVTYDGENN